MRLKIGFILRSLLLLGSFLGLVVLWSSLSPRLDDPSPLSRMRVSDPPAPSGGGDLQLVLFAREWREREPRGRARRGRRSSAGGAGDRGRRRAPSTGSPPPTRPLAAPSSRASPPRAPRAAAAALTAALLAGTSGRSGSKLGPWGRGARPPSPRLLGVGPRRSRRGMRGWSWLRPVAWAGLQEARCRRCHHHRSGPGSSVQLSLRPRPSGGAAAGAPLACPPPGGCGWKGDGAPPPALMGSVAAPASPAAGGRGAMGVRGLVLDRPFLPLPWQREGGWPDAGREAEGWPLPLWSRVSPPSHPPPTPLSGEALLPERRSCPGTWSQFLFPGCDRTARPGN